MTVQCIMPVQSSPFFCHQACCFYWYHHFSKRTAMYFWAAKRILDSRVIGLLLHSLRVVVSSFRVVKVVVGVKILTHMKKMMNDAFVRDRLCWLRGRGHQASEDCFVFIVAHIAPHYTRFRSLGRRNLFKLNVECVTAHLRGFEEDSRPEDNLTSSTGPVIPMFVCIVGALDSRRTLSRNKCC